VIVVGILFLGVDKGETGLDGVELIAPDAASQDFLPALVGVEFPARLGLDQRNGDREIVGAYDQRGLLPSTFTECFLS
jgi:hypothetical protein